ncbi:I78 family peptidase inhibitor [Altererythrobacter sp. KTW20L]|uniref:I78 family peptidase inhibitor n=1 Tax=Altererythrobacter sp. KTW20L TaxID=2942210 RepID=UPI0020BEA6B0|nr:I78 family peptidase inhibitor [Altererythrobacter sp. KTW20L]MCL6250431.1 I78 family peptidase inhibitor [Altererythrobacter sp. KTW20L]
MKTIAILGTGAAMLLAGCATAADGNGELPVRGPDGECDASGVQDHIGHRASAEAGQTLLRLTGARTLRWVPPRTAVTMDFRPDRLTVSYDDNMMIERISCG